MFTQLLPAICATVLGAAPLQQQPRGARPSQPQADTARPPLPPSFRFKQDTTRFAVSPQDSSVRYYRDIVAIQFQDSVSGSGVRELFAVYGAVVIGGLPEWPAYVVRVPDPGPTFRALDSLVSRIRHEPRVRLAYGITFHDAYNPQWVLQPSPALADTSVPPIPAVMTFPQDSTRIVQATDAKPLIPAAYHLPDDSSRIIRDRGDASIVYYRDIFALRFADSVSGRVVRAVFADYGAQVIGGGRGSRTYVVRVRDPGPSPGAFDSLVARMNREPGVEFAAPLTYRSGAPVVGALAPEPVPASSGTGRSTERTVPADTSRPPLPSTGNFFFPEDTAWSVASPGDTVVRYYRTVIAVLFDDSTTGVTVHRVLREYHATIIGGMHNFGAYVVRVPDPGPTYEAVDSLIKRLSNVRGVRLAFGLATRDVVRRLSR